ncbi:MAG: hypothetical protein ACI87O_001419 [Planctomycetota bacterium]|jgi:hypothetical protein
MAPECPGQLVDPIYMLQKIKLNTLSMTALLGCATLLCETSSGAGIGIGIGIGPPPMISDGELYGPHMAVGEIGPFLGDVECFAVLAGAAVTAAGTGTVITGEVGTAPGTAITGFPVQGIVEAPAATHSNDSAAIAAQASATALYANLANTPGATVISAELGGITLNPGVYSFASTANIAAGTTLTLDGSGLYIFKVGSAITANVLSSVILMNGATPGQVFWQVTSAATLNGISFSGTVVAQAAITLGVNVVLDGRALATAAGAVTMAGNATINVPCLNVQPLPLTGPDEFVGNSYCSSPINSIGQQSELSAIGSDLASDGDLTLTVTQVPEGQMGFLLASQTQSLLVNPASSSGNLCLGGDLARFNRSGEIGLTVGGSFSLDLPLSDFPEDPGFGSPVMPGDTWNFQYWHRDAVDGSTTSNFSNGLEILIR